MRDACIWTDIRIDDSHIYSRRGDRNLKWRWSDRAPQSHICFECSRKAGLLGGISRTLKVVISLWLPVSEKARISGIGDANFKHHGIKWGGIAYRFSSCSTKASSIIRHCDRVALRLDYWEKRCISWKVHLQLSVRGAVQLGTHAESRMKGWTAKASNIWAKVSQFWEDI